jgi:hypothetical protein
MNHGGALDYVFGGWNFTWIQTSQTGLPVMFTMAGSPSQYLPGNGVLRLEPARSEQLSDCTELDHWRPFRHQHRKPDLERERVLVSGGIYRGGRVPRYHQWAASGLVPGFGIQRNAGNCAKISTIFSRTRISQIPASSSISETRGYSAS